MLVLSRKPGQQIQIGPDITLTVVAVAGNRVKVGINAPAHISIARSEVLLDVLHPSTNATCPNEAEVVPVS